MPEAPGGKPGGPARPAATTGQSYVLRLLARSHASRIEFARGRSYETHVERDAGAVVAPARASMGPPPVKRHAEASVPAVQPRRNVEAPAPVYVPAPPNPAPSRSNARADLSPATAPNTGKPKLPASAVEAQQSHRPNANTAAPTPQSSKPHRENREDRQQAVEADAVTAPPPGDPQPVAPQSSVEVIEQGLAPPVPQPGEPRKVSYDIRLPAELALPGSVRSEIRHAVQNAAQRRIVEVTRAEKLHESIQVHVDKVIVESKVNNEPQRPSAAAQASAPSGFESYSLRRALG